MNAPNELVRQHLIDPEICIRCNTCEETCPVHAITHDSRNYVVKFEVCEGCQAWHTAGHRGPHDGRVAARKRSMSQSSKSPMRSTVTSGAGSFATASRSCA